MSNIIRLDKSGHLLVNGQPVNAPAPQDLMAVLVIDRSGSMAGAKTGYASSGAWDFSAAALNIRIPNCDHRLCYGSLDHLQTIKECRRNPTRVLRELSNRFD